MNDAYSKALNYLSLKDRSAKQISAYLKKYGFNDDEICICIDKLKEYGFINERTYAAGIMNKLKHKNYSLAKVEAYLKKEGIDDTCMTEILDELGDEYELASLNNFLAKELKNKKIDKTLLIKIKNKALRNGFKSYLLEDALIDAAHKFMEEEL